MSSASPRPHPETSATPSPEWLSAAADGDPDALDRALRVLREGDTAAAGRVRADWHAYHLIGDVLRSSELASAPRHDSAFMAGLRERLAAEPVVLAPVARPAAPRVARWRTPAAAVASVAGVAVVAGLLVMSRGGADAPGAGLPLAVAPEAAPRTELAASPVLRDGMLRDARIEEFMRVHQGAAGGLSLLPAGVRQVDVVVTPAPQR